MAKKIEADPLGPFTEADMNNRGQTTASLLSLQARTRRNVDKQMAHEMLKERLV